VEAHLSDFNEGSMNWLKHAGPFGAENPTPLFRITDPTVTEVKWLKGQHLKLKLREGTQTFEAMAFFAQGQYDVETGRKIEILAEPGWNYFRGEKRLQLIIRDLRYI
jgi:single-stranded-DNA-specific exonuclease